MQHRPNASCTHDHSCEPCKYDASILFCPESEVSPFAWSHVLLPAYLGYQAFGHCRRGRCSCNSVSRLLQQYRERIELTQWSSPYIYHVHNFGDNNDAGIGNGWNTTTIVDTDTTVNIERVLYSQQLQLMIAPPSLTYLMHAPYSTVPGAAPGTIVLTHYITTAGPSGFDHIVTANVFPANTSNPLPFRPTWPLFLTFDGTTDAFANKLTTTGGTGGNYTASLNVYDEMTNEPVTIAVVVRVAIDYYSGTCDGFAGFCTLCPNVGNPESPSVCLTNTTTSILNDPSAMPTEAPAESAGKAKTSHVVWNVVALVSGLLLIIWLGYYYYQKNYTIDNSGEPSNGLSNANDNAKYTNF